jgi:hypothetical protein
MNTIASKFTFPISQVKRGKIDHILDALPGRESRLPALSIICIKSHVIIDPEGLIRFLSRRAGAERLQLRINFTPEDISSHKALPILRSSEIIVCA